MKQKDSNYLSMAAAALRVLQENQSVWAKQAMFAKIVGEIDEDVKAVNTAIGNAGAKSNAVSASKWLAADIAINSAVKYSGLAQIHALETDNNVLFNELSTSASQLRRFSDQELAPALQNISNKLSPLKDVLEPYGVSATGLKQLQADIDAFKASKDQPRVIIAQRKGFNQDIPELLGKIKTSFFKLDRLIKIWQDTDTRFITDYENARLVISRGTRRKTNDAPPTTPL